MHIVVVVRMTPDTEAAVSVDAAGRVNWGEKYVVNPWDEYAITEAVLLKEKHGGQVTLLTLGHEVQEEALKHGLAIGCDAAIRLMDPALEPADGLVYAKTVAAAIRKIGGVDLVIFGREFVDLAADQHIFQVARKLNWTLLSAVAKIEAIDPAVGTIRVRRLVEQGTQIVSGRLPAVISVLKDINEPKYPTFIGIRKAAKAVIPLWGAADLGLTPADLTPHTAVIGHREPAKHTGTAEIIQGATAREKAQALVDKLLQEKVL